MFKPKFTLTPAITKALMDIEACRQAVTRLPLSVPMLESLRKSARLLSTHFSTQIEGNKLSASQVEEVIAGGGRFPGRERDEAEVRHYYLALEFAVAQGRTTEPLTEDTVRTIHGLVMTGKAKATAYRDGQNVIRDGRTGVIEDLPPEAKDVPGLMEDLVGWIDAEIGRDELPVPIIAGLAHYQFATIHPYYDGNGRTARLLTTLILHRAGYGLHGMYSLEEHYAKTLGGYYEALALGASHNYYDGRADADVTTFLAYFILGMADSFASVRSRAEDAERGGAPDQTASLRDLDARQRRALALFLRTTTITSRDVAAFFNMSARPAAALCVKWTETGFLEIADPSKKARRYRLTVKYEGLVAAQAKE